jgi:hypothetical protein
MNQTSDCAGTLKPFKGSHWLQTEQNASLLRRRLGVPAPSGSVIDSCQRTERGTG